MTGESAGPKRSVCWLPFALCFDSAAACDHAHIKTCFMCSVRFSIGKTRAKIRRGSREGWGERTGRDGVAVVSSIAADMFIIYPSGAAHY